MYNNLCLFFSFVFLIATVGLIGCDSSTEPDATDPDPELTPVGIWMAVLDEPVLGPDDEYMDVLFIEFGQSDFMILSFLYSDPAAGMKGSYVYDEETGEIQIDVTHVLSEEVYGWMETNFSVVLPAIYSPENDGIGTDEFYLERRTLSNPTEIAGTWIWDIATLEIETNGTFIWEQGEPYPGIQSGMAQVFDEMNGDTYWILNLTYDTFGAGGECDYYIVNRYELSADGNELTFWHGDEMFVLALE